MFARTLAAAALLSATGALAQPDDQAHGQAAWSAQCAAWDEWDKPGPPFRVHGDTWYVGTCGIAAILVTGDAGHVLIDSGTEAGAELVLANIRALGFDPGDVKVLLASHEHFDHVGGIARLQQATGARLLVSPRAAPVMMSGLSSAEDPQAGMHAAFPAARVDGRVLDGVPVQLGNLRLTPMESPGHTPGATTWFWRACAGEDCRTIVYADSLSPVSADSYRFGDHAVYLADYRRSIARLAQLECDILLTPHPSASAMPERLRAGGLADPNACRAYAADLAARLDRRLAEEADGE